MAKLFSPLERGLLVCTALIFVGFLTVASAQETATPPTKEEQIATLEILGEKWRALEAEQAALHQQAKDIRRGLCQSGVGEYCEKGKAYPITVTNYNPEKGQTDGSPCTGASGQDQCALVKQGVRVIALSQDLVGRSPSKPFTYGDKVLVEGKHEKCSGVFTVLDTMNARFTNYADIFHLTREENFGVCKGATVRKIL